MTDTSVLTVQCPQFTTLWRRYDICVDGEVVGKIGYRHPVEVELPAGPHEVAIRFKAWAAAVDVDASEGHPIRLSAGIHMPPMGLSGRELRTWMKANTFWLSADAVKPQKPPAPMREVPRWRIALQAILLAISVLVVVIVFSRRGALGAAFFILAVIAITWRFWMMLRSRRTTRAAQ